MNPILELDPDDLLTMLEQRLRHLNAKVLEANLDPLSSKINHCNI